MGTSITVNVVRAVHCLVGLAAIMPVLADDPTTAPMLGIQECRTKFPMTLSLSSESAPLGYGCSVAPLTLEAGLNQSNGDVEGTMVVIGQSNFNEISYSGAIAYLACDPSTTESDVTPNEILSTVMNKKPKAIILYSLEGACCSLGGSNLPFDSVWTMTDAGTAEMARNLTTEASGTVLGTITGNDTSVDGNMERQQGGSNSAIAMSILYSITGLITLLFLVIIGTGAVRAHRHPERYGPRASFGGRPRQGRAMGLARAVLETLPIVKFGGPNASKSDPENTEMGRVSGDQPEASGVREEAPTGATEQRRPSMELPTDGTLASSSATAAVAAGSDQSQQRDPNDDSLGCSICTEDFAVGEDVRVLPCDHKFHPTCVDPWLVNVSGTCPLCRLDLRPHGSNEDQPSNATDAQINGHLDSARESDRASDVSPPEAETNDQDAAQRRRRSRLLDWNRLRNASVDERIQALRQYRQSQQANPANDNIEAVGRRPRLTDRMRERFHIRTRSHTAPDNPPSDII